MKSLILLLIVAMLNVLSVCGQQDSIQIKGHLINNSHFPRVLVQKYNVGTVNVASAPIENEKFSITAPPNLEPGVYRLQYSQSSKYDYVEVIINGKEKNIAFSIDLNQPERPVTFTASKVNKAWHDYQNQKNRQLQNIASSQQLMANYSDPKAAIVIQSKAALKKDIERYNAHRNRFLSAQGTSWAAQMVKNRPVYFANPFASLQLQDYNRQEHFWDGIDTTNPKLINSPLYTEHILTYVQYYMGADRGFSADQIVEELIKCVDTIMQKFGGHKMTQYFALKYLQLGFKEIGHEELLQHIDKTYQELILSFTEDKKEQSDFKQRMAGYETLKPGNQAPSANFMSPEGTFFDLKEVKNKHTVLAFWASWCPSCEEQMPLVEAYAKNHSDVTVVAVSLDEDKEEFTSAIENYPSMKHSCDFKNYEGQVVSDYYIYASPTFIVLDDEHKIVGKYSNWEAAEKGLH